MASRLGRLLAIAALVAIFPLVNLARPTQAASGTRLYLSPASQTVTTGSNLAVAIVIDPGGASVNTVQSVFTYSSTNFTLVSITPGGAFGSFPNSASSGSIQFSAASSSPVTTVQTVATVTLRATGLGTSAASLAGVCPAGNYGLTCSAAYDSVTSNNDLSSVSNGNYTVAAAPVVPPVTPTAPSAPATPSTPAAGGSGAKATPSTPHSSSSSSDNSGIDTTPAATPSTDTTPATPDANDGSSGQAPATDLTIAIRITDAQGKPIKGAKITSVGQTRTTDEAGTATFQKLPTGRQVFTIKAGMATTSRTINIGQLDPKTGAPQQAFTLTASRGSSLLSPLTIILVALLIAGFILFMSTGLARHIGKGPGGGSAGGHQATVTPASVSYKQVIAPGTAPDSAASGIPVASTQNPLAHRPDAPAPGTTITPEKPA